MNMEKKLCWGCEKPLEQIEEAFKSPVWVCANQECQRFGLLTVVNVVPKEEKKTKKKKKKKEKKND